jgi:flagellar basal-body rod protein FlgG
MTLAQMERGLYIAASGMLTEGVRQDLISHDLANASTPGYKPDRVAARSFEDVLLTEQTSGAAVGRLGTGTRVADQVTDLSPGPVRDTGEPLDFAVEGEGFFAVRTPGGLRYTRNGQFQAAADRTLVTAQGDQVVGRDGGPVRIGADGVVDARRLDVVQLRDARKQGDALFTGTPAAGQTGQARAGALESSATNPITAMVDMISSLRSFESGQRVITTIDSTLQKATNQVGGI